MKRDPRSAAVISILMVALVGRSAHAMVFSVPPVTINTLTHQNLGGNVEDFIFIPGPGYTSSGFTSSFATGDVVRVRIQAPAGKMFRVHAPPGGTSMTFNVHWLCTGGSTSHFNSALVSFEN